MHNFREAELEILKFWEENQIYEKRKEKNKNGKKFYFLQGPPYTSGRLHIGQAWNNALKDLILRFKRMQGFNVWDRGGYDMHGLPTENKVQSNLKLADKNAILQYGIEKFIHDCIAFSTNSAQVMNKDLTRLGVWLDHEHAYFPINEEFIEGEWFFIKKAWEQKRLYQGKKVMHWCFSCETALAKHELEYKNVKDKSIYLKFRCKNNEQEFLILWTTTPWTIPFNLAVMVNPEIDYIKAKVGEETWIIAKQLADQVLTGVFGLKYALLDVFKGEKLLGLEYEHPLGDEINYHPLKKQWPKVHSIILSHKYVDTTSGSGLVHCAPGCGPEDYEVAQQYGIGSFNTLDEKGIFTEIYAGWRAKRDDAKFIEKLKNKGVLLSEISVEHDYAHCWRCKNPIIFRSTEQWFLRIEDLIPKLISYNERVYWHPKFGKTNMKLWMESLKDNSITRQRFWGCPVPIWKCSSCNAIEVIGSLEELKIKAGKIPENLHRPWIDRLTIPCDKCRHDMTRIEDVIDVWIDSGTASWNSLYYPRETIYFKKFFPPDVILEATEQIRLWFSMLQICSAIAFRKPSYKNVYMHGMILDFQGMKMSKSLGNVISPYEVIDKYSADIFRYYICQNRAGENMHFNWEDIKIKQKNLMILLHTAQYLKELGATSSTAQLDLEEKYIISRKETTLQNITHLLDEYKLDEIIGEIESLILDISRIYIKFTREKIFEEKEKVASTLFTVYIDALKMFSIIAPFITETIWQDLRRIFSLFEESIHLADWPKLNKKRIDKNLEFEFAQALKIIELGLAGRDALKIGLKWPLAGATIFCTKKLEKRFNEIILQQLNVKTLEWREIPNQSWKVDLDSIITPELEAEGFAREISRKIQSERKIAGLVKSDLIDLFMICSPHLKERLSSYMEIIAKKTNAYQFHLNRDDTNSLFHTSTFKIKEEIITIAFSKKNREHTSVRDYKKLFNDDTPS